MVRSASLMLALLALGGCGSSSNTFANAPATTQLIPDGSYVATAAVAKSGGQTTNVPVTGALTNSYTWLGGGKYTEKIGGVGAFGGNTVDCTNPNEFEITLAEDGHMVSSTTIRTGCVPVATLPPYAVRYRVITNGVQREIDVAVNGAPTTFVYTYLKK